MERILIIDNDEEFRKKIAQSLSSENYKITFFESGEAGLNSAKQNPPDLIITALSLIDCTGINILQSVKQFDHNIQVIVTTAVDDIESTILAMQFGAFDFIEKSLELERLRKTVKLALENKKLKNQSYFFISNEKENYTSKFQLIGRNPLMKEVYKKIGKVSANKVTVYIEGESGTGKELIAKNIHNLGITKNDPFVAVNCAALSETLLESELFGHVKGSFTGAIREKKGKFELAGNGTIFLDEISEISLNLQTKLLRVLQEHEVEKVGGDESFPIHSRIITASNKDLFELVEQGKFREDLYYRLKVFSIEVPPLRERKDDIPHLAVYLLNKINKELGKKVTKIPYEVMDVLQNHSWHGNVREMENCLLQAVVLAKDEILEKEYLILRNGFHKDHVKQNVLLSLDDIQKEHIKKVLESVNWNKAKACKILKICKATLYNKLEQYNISMKKTYSNVV